MREKYRMRVNFHILCTAHIRAQHLADDPRTGPMKNASDSVALVGEITALPNGDQKLGNWEQKMTAAKCRIRGPDGVIAPSAMGPLMPRISTSGWLQHARYPLLT